MNTHPKKRKTASPTGIFRQIFVFSRGELSPFGMVFVFEPENFEQKKLGTLFGIIKISDTSQESSYVANLIASVIKKEFFSKPERPTDASFEASLRKANLALAELARRGSVKWAGGINFAGGALERNNLHFTKLGATAILLLREGMIADIGADLENTETTESHPLKTFSDISSGKLEIGDCLLFTTSDLLEIFSLEEIRQNATRFSRKEFPDILSASLAANSELSGVIVLNMAPEEEAVLASQTLERKKIFPPHLETFRKIPDLEKRKPAPRKLFPTADFSIPTSPPEPPKNQLFISDADEVIPKKSLGKFLSNASQKISGFFSQASATVFATAKKTTDSVRIYAPSDKFRTLGSVFSKHGEKGGFFSSFSKIVGSLRWPKLNSKNFAITGMAIFLIVVLAVLGLLRSKKPTNPQTAPTSTSNPGQSQAPLEDINVKNIESVFDVAKLPQGSSRLLALGDSLFSLAGEKSILKIDPASGDAEKIDSPIATGKFLLAAPMPDLNTIFIFTADKKLLSFTPSNKKFQENNIALPDNLSAADMKTYLTYIYFLDPGAGQIYRYPRAEGGFGERQDWLKNGTDIKNSNSFGINEDLYVASQNKITPFVQGKKDEKLTFENPNVSLAIDKIFTNPDFQNIYILDNKNQRIVQYSKDGKIIAQYFNQSITDVKDFVIDEKNKIVYLRKSSDLIQKFSMEQ